MTAPGAEAFERATLTAWPAEHRAARFGWEFCASGGGCSARPNSIWPLAWEHGASLDEAIAAAEAWCARRHIPLQFKLADGAIAPVHLPERLSALGFAPFNTTLAMTRGISAASPLSGVALHHEPNDAIWRPLRESAPSAEDFAERRDIVLRIAAPRIFALADFEGAPAAIGLGVLTGDKLGIFLMRTAPEARRHGLARKIVRALIGWGAGQGARIAYLQVEQHNRSAIALYESEGFATLYTYAYWRRA